MIRPPVPLSLPVVVDGGASVGQCHAMASPSALRCRQQKGPRSNSGALMLLAGLLDARSPQIDGR